MRLSLEEARRVVGEFERSGLTRRGFAAERGMSVHTLDGYRLRLKRAIEAPARPAAGNKPEWVEVKVGAEAGRNLEPRIQLGVGRRRCCCSRGLTRRHYARYWTCWKAAEVLGIGAATRVFRIRLAKPRLRDDWSGVGVGG